MKRLAAVLLAALVLCACEDKNEKLSRSLFAMDTYMTLTAYGSDSGEGLDKAVDRIKDLEKLLSVTDTGSEIYKADHSDGSPVEVSPETAELVSFALDMYQKTGGALDISIYPVLREWGFTGDEHHVPDDAALSQLLEYVGADRISTDGSTLTVPAGMMIDLGSVAKGYAGDMAAKALRDSGVKSALIDLGGNIQTVGTKPDGSLWKIGIRDPESDGSFGVLSIGEKAVITSGGYERFFVQEGKVYHHIIDPSTGRPAESGLVSVTVVGDRGVLCDALSTSLFILGAEGAEELWRREGGFDYIALTDEREVLITESIADSFELDPAHSAWKVTVIE